MSQKHGPAPSLIQNPALLFVFYDNLQILDFVLVHIHRQAPRSRGTLHKNEPPRLILGKAQKICFPIHLEIHCNPPPP
jgi:hypothetical protein